MKGRVMKRIFWTTLILAKSATVWAASCGTLASPTPCSVTVNGTHKFTWFQFRLNNPVASGGGIQYQASDIAIDLSVSQSGAAVMTLTKNPNGASPGNAFSVTAGQFSAFTITSLLKVQPLVPGVAAYSTTKAQMNLSLTGFLNQNNVIQSIVGGVINGFPGLNLNLTPTVPLKTGSIVGSPNPADVGHILNLSSFNATANLTEFSTELGVSFTPTATNVSGQVLLTQTGFVKNRSTGQWVANMNVTNVSGSTITGPIHVLFNDLPAAITMTNATGLVGDIPFITVTPGNLAPGSSASVTIQFSNSSSGFITFTPATYAGAI